MSFSSVTSTLKLKTHSQLTQSLFTGTDCLFYLFILGFASLSTLYRSYHDGSWKGRGNQYIELVRVLYCKLPTSGKQLPAFPLEAMLETEPQPQRWEARVLPLCHCGPLFVSCNTINSISLKPTALFHNCA